MVAVAAESTPELSPSSAFEDCHKSAKLDEATGSRVSTTELRDVLSLFIEFRKPRLDFRESSAGLGENEEEDELAIAADVTEVEVGEAGTPLLVLLPLPLDRPEEPSPVGVMASLPIPLPLNETAPRPYRK